jgi:hypothetical protein
VKLDAATKDRSHDAIEGHEGAPDKLVVVEEGTQRAPWKWAKPGGSRAS